MTMEERALMGKCVERRLAERKIDVFRFEKDLVTRIQKRQLQSPAPPGKMLVGETCTWAVFSSVSDSRDYPWGDAQVRHWGHNELPALQALLLEEGGWMDL